jgi:hypothetical protein
MFCKISEGCKDIAKQMIDNPHDWVQTQYEYVNVTSKDIRIWTANGMTSIELNGNDAFNIREKAYLNSAIKKSIANRLLKPKEGKNENT